MRIRFCRFDRSFGARNFEQPRKLLKRLSQRVPQSVDRALRPDVSKDEAGDDQTKKDSDDAIANVIEIGIGRVTLKDAVEESECDLQPSITDPLGSKTMERYKSEIAITIQARNRQPRKTDATPIA